MSETTAKRTALLLGASGLVGSHCLELLLDDAAYGKVMVAVRKKLPLINEKLEQHTVDFDHLEDYPHVFDVNDIFCCLGTTIKQAGSRAKFRKVDHDYPLQAAQLGLIQGAEQFLLISSLSADKNSLVFYSKVKGETEDDIKKLSYQSIQIFQPSLLLGNREQPRSGEKIGEALLKIFSFALKGRYKKYKGIQAATVAFAMIACAKQDEPGIHTYTSDKIQSIADRNSR